jgi:putative toxin-antitoxin system antitoxin component (TIGR02293 family)
MPDSAGRVGWTKARGKSLGSECATDERGLIRISESIVKFYFKRSAKAKNGIAAENPRLRNLAKWHIVECRMALAWSKEMENASLVREYLGGVEAIGKPKSDLDFVSIIRRGLPFSVLASIRDRAKLSEEMICSSLRIARRTAARRKEQAARLKPTESELVLRLARVCAAAADALGDEDKARRWLVAENRALGGEAPIRLLDTGVGFQEVMDVLGRIEHGVYS